MMVDAAPIDRNVLLDLVLAVEVRDARVAIGAADGRVDEEDARGLRRVGRR